MFLEQLNDDQKKSFLALATRMILADGDVAPEEDEILESIKTEMGGSVMAPPEEVFGSTNADNFPDRKGRVIALLELLVMAHSDSHLHADESAVLDEICGALKVSDEERETMTAWAKRVVGGEDMDGLRSEAEAMMADG